MDKTFSFLYGGKGSGDVLDSSQYTFAGFTEGDGERTGTGHWLTSDGRLRVTRTNTRYEGFASCVDMRLRFENVSKDGEPTDIIDRVLALDKAVCDNEPGEVVVHRLRGCSHSEDDWMPYDTVVKRNGIVRFGPRGGRSSDGMSPFFNVSWDNGRAGVIVAVGWSGRWDATVSHEQNGSVRVEVGMDRFHARLEQGEHVVMPRVLLLEWNGDEWDGYNEFRRLMREHVMPQDDGHAVRAPLASLGNSGTIWNRITEGYVLEHLDGARGLGFDTFWLDAFYTNGGFPNGVGNYGWPLRQMVDRARFPNGLEAIADEAHKAGMEFMLWVEPERVARETSIAMRSPEWVLRADGQENGLLDLGRLDVRGFVGGWLVDAVLAYGLRWLRVDFNIDPAPFWRAADQKGEDRVGIAEAHYIEGLYLVWDYVRAVFSSNLFIDNCASGGRRIDLETCSRSLPLWTSDKPGEYCDYERLDDAALQLQTMRAGLNRYVPISLAGQKGADPYHFRSAFNGGIASLDDTRARACDRKQWRKALAEAKRIQRYWDGDFYVLAPVTRSPADWSVFQYHLPDVGAGMVLGLRRHKSQYAEIECELREIASRATYEVTTRHGYEVDAVDRMSGQVLLDFVLRVEDRPGSVLVEYKRVSGQAGQEGSSG